jgi:hypothetical protein
MIEARGTHLGRAERLIAAWNERQALRAPMIFSPTIGAAIRAGYWAVGPLSSLPNDQRDRFAQLDRHRDAAVSSLIPALSCRSCRPNAPFAELVRLSRTSIADRTCDFLRVLQSSHSLPNAIFWEDYISYIIEIDNEIVKASTIFLTDYRIPG